MESIFDSQWKAILENPKVNATIDDDEWRIFETHCRKHNVKYRIVCDYDDGVLVSMGIADLVRYEIYAELGEE